VIEYLPAGPGTEFEARAIDGAGHPMRRVTHLAASDPAAWAAAAGEVRSQFEELAAGWNDRFTDRAELFDPLLDALDRGSVARGGRAFEPGSGTGNATPALIDHFDDVVSLDLAAEMLRRAPGIAPRVQGDSSSLPFVDDAFTAIVHVNALLFPSEVDRVLAPGGVVVWVSTLGASTPIYLSAEELVAALPGAWSAVASSAGIGTWCVARREPNDG
jgi:SAM-dependent methyltransferase